jgi:phosphohistidine swiveling domain-containing protein
MANTIRNQFREEVEALKPLLHDTYRAIGRFQKDKTARNERRLRALLPEAGAALLFFKPHLQRTKQPYFDAVLTEELNLSDRIIALDTAVGFMHIDFPVSRAYSHAETAALRRVLEEVRQHPGDRRNKDSDSTDSVLRGLAASPGCAGGLAHVVLEPDSYASVPEASVVVAPMTRPDLVIAAHKAVAIVTDTGGMLCHAAIVAREWGIPCVVGTTRATSRIRNGQLVVVDGSEGLVTIRGDE